MKKKILTFILLFMMCFSVKALTNELEEVNGLTTIFEKNDISLNKKYNSTLIVGANNIHNNSIVDGINIGFANYIEDNSSSDYALLAGTTVNVKNNINKDLFVFGSYVNINSTVNRDLFVYAKTLELSGIYNRNLAIMGNSITLNDVEIKGNIWLNADSITIGDNVVINGVLKYNDNLEIKGNLVNIQTETYKNEKTTWEFTLSFLINVGSWCILFLLLACIIPKMFTFMNNKLDNNEFMYPIVVIGKGAFNLILFLILIILSFILVIGTYIGVGLIFIFIAIICLSTLYTSYYLGRIIWNKLLKQQDNILLSGFIGIIVVSFINLIPIIQLFTILLGMGLIIDNIDLKKLKD